MRSFTLVVGFLLAAHPVASQTHGPIEGRSKLFYESLGKGPETIVVVHGGPGIAHDYMRPEWDQLAASGRVIYYDQNGCGRSERVPPYGWRSHLDDLDRLLDTLAPKKRVVLAGSSWGSMLALFYTYEHPERVKALVLSGVPLGTVGTAPKSSAAWLQQQSKSRWDSVNRGLPVGKGNLRPPLESRLQERIKEDCADVAGIVNMSMGDAPHGQTLESITVPALVIHGANPEQMSGDGGPGLAEILPNAKLVTIADAGHDPWLDQPKEFFAAANTFLARLPSVARVANPRCFLFTQPLGYSASGALEQGVAKWYVLELEDGGAVSRPLFPRNRREQWTHRSRWTTKGDTLLIRVFDGLVGWDVSLTPARGGYTGVAAYLTDVRVEGYVQPRLEISAAAIKCPIPAS